MKISLKLGPECAISHTTSSWRPITSGVPQESILDPNQFNVFFNDLDDGAQCNLSKLNGDATVRVLADTPKDHVAV